MKRHSKEVVTKYYNLHVTDEEIANWRNERSVSTASTSNEVIRAEVVKGRIQELIGGSGEALSFKLLFAYEGAVSPFNKW